MMQSLGTSVIRSRSSSIYELQSKLQLEGLYRRVSRDYSRGY